MAEQDDNPGGTPALGNKMKDFRDLASDLVGQAVARGAEHADVYVKESRSLSIDVRLGRVERLDEAVSEGIGVRVFKHGRSALAYSSDISGKSLEQLVDDTLALADATDPDPCNRLPESRQMGAYGNPLDLCDPALAEIPTEDKIERVCRTEAAGLARDARINNSNGAWWKDTLEQVTLANSAGFVDSYLTSRGGLGVSLVAEENGIKQSESWWSSGTALKRMDPPETIGRMAAERTLRKLGSRPVKTQTVPVLFDPQVGADFLKILFDAVNGRDIYRRNSFLLDKLGSQVGSTHLNIVDDATQPGALASRPFDGEGVCSRRTDIIREGRLLTYLCDAYTSCKLGHANTGSATRSIHTLPTVGPTNFYLEPGTVPPDEIVRSLSRGLMVTRLYWVGINLATGDYSRGAEGFWIENGAIAYPVQEITIAGNMMEMLQRIEVIGNDLDFRSAIGSPSFLVSQMVISGSH